MTPNDSTYAYVRLIPEQMQQLCDMVASTIIKRMQPAEDILSQRTAYKIYGKAWVQRMEARYPSIRKRSGKYWQYSRSKMDELIATVPTATLLPVKRYGSPNKQD